MSQELTPGKAAIVAEIEEDRVKPLDSRMEAVGGVVLRAWRDDLEDERIRREADRHLAALAQLHTECAQAAGDSKPKLETRAEEARTKCQTDCARVAARLERLRQETDSKIEALQEQAAETKADKEKIERRIAEIRADDERRSVQLQQTREQTGEALAA